MSQTIRKARTLATSLTVLLIGTAFYVQNVRAEGCGANDKLLESTRPADCARLLQATPEFAWPAVRGAQGYVVSVTHPDGRVVHASTDLNGFAWQQPLPAGEYAWTVTPVGAAAQTAAERRFSIDSAASRR